jgi:hypothetical protein
MDDDTVKRIEAFQRRIEQSLAAARRVMQRQNERLEENRRVIDWATGRQQSRTR